MDEKVNGNLITEDKELIDTLITNIYVRLTESNWSLKMLSDKADLPYESIKKLVNRKIQKPSFQSIWQISQALGCSLDELAGSGGKGQRPIGRSRAESKQLAEKTRAIQALMRELEELLRKME